MTRGRFEGVLNIVRFNWPMFVTTGVVAVGALTAAMLVHDTLWRPLLIAGAAAITLGVFISLAASHLVYDRSDLYRFHWLTRACGERHVAEAIFCQTGFDESSALLRARDHATAWTLLDHYDPTTMTEASIQRARRRCPPASGTRAAPFAIWPVDAQATDLVIGMLAVHELRHDVERVAWFSEARRVTRADGTVIVVEHVRDMANFAVFGPGALHFHAVHTWTRNWEAAHLRLRDTFRITPWVRVFVLEHA